MSSNKNVNYTGGSYSKFRPSYSDEIYSLIYQSHASHQGAFQLAVDVGCGTGQVTTEIAKKFDQVYGIDPLEDQIKNASPKDNIIYQVGSAEDLSQFKDHSVDMVTVGTAFHWFQHEAFLKEAKRVLKKGTGTLAIIGYFYQLVKDQPKANQVLLEFRAEKYDKYANTNYRYIENLYRDIKIPFEHQKWYITPKSQDTTNISGSTQIPLMEASMTVDNFCQLMKTASAYSNYINDEKNQGKLDPVDEMMPNLMKALNVTDKSHLIDVEWPTVLILAQNDA